MHSGSTFIGYGVKIRTSKNDGTDIAVALEAGAQAWFFGCDFDRSKVDLGGNGHIYDFAGGSDTSGTTTLLARMTATRAGNLDYLDATISSRMATFTYATPPSKTDISAQVASDLATAHGSGSWTTANLPTDYQQRDVAVTLPAAPTGYGGTISDEQIATIAADIAVYPSIAAMAAKVAGFTTAPIAAVSPMTTDVDIDLTQYDDYMESNGRVLYWANADGSWAGGNLHDATIIFTAKDSGGVVTLAKPADAFAETAPQAIHLELIAAESGLFTRVGKQYTYQILIVKAGFRETRIEGSIIVSESYSVPSVPAEE